MKPFIIYFSPSFSYFLRAQFHILSSARTLNRKEKKTQGLNLIPQLYKGVQAAISKAVRYCH